MNPQTTDATRQYSTLNTGIRAQWPDHVAKLPGVDLPGKQFLQVALGLSSCEISVNSLQPGTGMPFHHTHRENEEVYIFLKGRGQMQIDGDLIEVGEGSVVRIAPPALRTWRNSGDEQLQYIVIQAREHSLRQSVLTDGVVPPLPVTWPQ